MLKIQTTALSTIAFAVITCVQLSASPQAFADGCCAPKCKPCATPICPVVPLCGAELRTERRTVMVPEVVTQNRTIERTVLKKECREKEVTVLRRVPETVERTRTCTVMEPVVRTR